jgi:hypothetical protein
MRACVFGSRRVLWPSARASERAPRRTTTVPPAWAVIGAIDLDPFLVDVLVGRRDPEAIPDRNRRLQGIFAVLTINYRGHVLGVVSNPDR